MKNIIRFICAILFLTLGTGYPVSAAENLKEVRDKYRNSYNKFMNALKQGADQNTIDQLSSQCKTDYDEYQKVASGKSGNAEKSRNTSVSSTASVMAQNSQNNSLKVNEKKLEEMKKEAIKKMKECSPDSILMVEQEIMVNGKLYKYKTFAPETSKNKKKTSTLKLKKITAPLRISEPVKDSEAEAKEILDNIAKQLDSFNPTEADSQEKTYLEIDRKLHEICIKYPQYSYICAKAKIYAVNLYMKANFKDNLTRTYQITNLCGEIKEYYSRDKNPLTIKALEMLTGEVAILNQKIEQAEKSDTENINKKLEEAQNYKKVFEKNIKENSGQIYPSEGYWPSFAYDLNNTLDSYSEAAYACAFNGHYLQAKEIMDEMESLYNSAASEVTVTYNVRYGSDKTTTKTIIIKKNSGSYWAAKGSYTLAMKMRLQRYYYDDDRTLSLERVNEEIKKFNEGKNAPPGSNETDNFPTELAIVQGMLEPITEPKFKEVYFTKPEETRLSSDEIVDSSDEVTLKLVLDETTTSKLIPINVEVSSNVSERHKRIKLRPNTFYGPGYYARIKFNEDESGNDRNQNLIKKHGNEDEELKNTVCVADGNQYLQEYYSPYNPFYEVNPFKKIITDSTFFKNKVLGKGVVRKLAKDAIDLMPIRKKFLDKMGYEVVSILLKDYQPSIYVANQADWFIYVGHGDYSKGAIMVKDRDNKQYAQCAPIDPIPGYDLNDFFKTNNINLSFLVIGGCQIIKADIAPSPGLNWAKMFGSQTVILGYEDYTFPRNSSYAIYYLTKYLDENNAQIKYPYIDNNFKNTIIEQWVKINYELGGTIFSIYSSQYVQSKSASAIFNKTFYTFKDAKTILKPIVNRRRVVKVNKTNYEIIRKDISSIL